MKKHLECIVIIILFVISFIFTNNVSNIVRDKDPVMIDIKNKRDLYRVESVNGIINNDEIIAGKNGCEIDINKSYKEMKKVNKYAEAMLKYKDLVPEITLNNTYDKYISGGNNKDRNVSIVIYIKKDINILNDIDTKLNIFLDSELLRNGKIDIIGNKKIYNGGTNNTYENINIEWVNDLISEYNKPSYCLNLDKNDNNLVICMRNKMHSIYPKINGNNIYKLKKDIMNGSIIYFDENNINNLNQTIKYLNSKGYNIVYLDELLNEKTCK